MKASELRIGNLVNVPREDQSPFRIDLIEYATIELMKVGMNIHKYEFAGKIIDGHPLTWELKDLSGIPLSEEILLKCGFVLMNKWFDYELSLFRIGYITNNKYFQFESNGKVIDIKSLHQLQNIVYFNTEQELDVSKLF